MPDLSVVVVSYNSVGWLRPCLQSLYAGAGGCKLEVIVVDSDSSDGSPELVEREFPQATVLRRANRGFAAANNVGLAAASAPFVLFLNPDTEILDGTFRELLDLLAARPAVGMVGCRQVSANGALVPTIRRFPSASRYLFEALGSERLSIDFPWLGERVRNPDVYEHETACDWTSGSFMLARREVLTAVGGMDERYFLYCEEPDLCLRIKDLGWEVRHLPAMTILHHGSGINERLIAQDAYARRQYMLKNMSPGRRRTAALAFALGHALRAAYPVRDPSLRRVRRTSATRAIRLVLGRGAPPFGPNSTSVSADGRT
jgi:N-acetylglucosaminyl-diphospho-decaprenol L-rhamnosyltransferase